MPIGRFARSCRLTIKALRHYDDLGLLRPAHVDRATGYRYYSREQARSAIVIAMLRSLGMPLPTIRAVVSTADADAIDRVLRGERERIERELARSRQALLSLERVIRSRRLLPYEVSIREEPARLILKLAGTTSDERHIEDTITLVDTLLERLRRGELAWSEPVMCLLPEPAGEDDFSIEVGAAVKDPTAEVEDATLELLPGGPCAIVTHVGAYEELALAHHALAAWIQERGHAEAGPLREYYLNDPRQVETAALVTEVLQPIVERRA